MKTKLVTLLGLCCLVLASAAFAAESQFGFVYTTDLLPKGETEVEQWLTWKSEKKQGTFNLIESRTALEYGVLDNFQVSIYANYAWTEAYHNGPDGTTTLPEPFSHDKVDPDEKYSASRFTGISLEGIYRFLSPYTDSIGLAVLLEPTWGPDFFEMETKLLLQKNFLDDRLTLAFNFSHAPEFRYLPQDDGSYAWEQETDINYYFAGSYRFASNWSAGVELLNEQEYSDYLDGAHLVNNGYYFGPTLHYSTKTFFLTVTYLQQQPWAVAYADTLPGAVHNGYIYDNDFERNRLRIKLAWVF